LGGTSNHFQVDLLRKIGGWDPYNVTEDADLGMRASSLGYRVDTISATTWEEACSKVRAFIPQRTRWIKGYIITSLVDLRQPITFIRSAGWRSTFTLFGLIVGTPALFLAYPLVWAATILTFLFPAQLSPDVPQWMVTAGSLTRSWAMGRLSPSPPGWVCAATGGDSPDTQCSTRSIGSFMPTPRGERFTNQFAAPINGKKLRTGLNTIFKKRIDLLGTKRA